MVNAINVAFGAAVASFTAGGQLRLDSTVLGANLGIVVAENNSAINIATETRGFSHFFGLNDLFTDTASYANYDSSVQTSATAPLNISGNLTFNLPGGGTATIALAAANTLEQIATAINGDGTLNAANVQGRLVYDGAGYRLNVLDTDGNNFFLAGTGTALSGLGLVANRLSSCGTMTVRGDIVDNPRLVSRGDVAYDVTLAVGDVAIGAGDGAAARRLADVFNQNQSLPLAGGLPQLSATLAQYASQILALNSIQASTAKDELEFGASLREQLSARVASVSGVNMDEELSNLILLENAYAATARIITVTDKMFEALISTI
jgi:flagellar hook-associated protein 1 FlgK